MKKFIKFFAIVALVCAFFLVGCSNDSNNDIETNEISLKTPTHEVLALSIDELSKNISEKYNIKITEINYWDVPENIKGFVAEVNYLNTDNESKKVLIVRHIPNIDFDSSLGVGYVSNSRLASGDIYISCSGPGCCYPSGSIDMNTGNMTTSCKCEGNSNQNSSCIMKISSTIGTGTN